MCLWLTSCVFDPPQVSIGLPTFLLDKDKSAFVIFFYLMGFVAIAVAVYW